MNEYINEVINYRGIDIEVNFYGRGEFSFQWCGDDIICETLEEAKKVIDELTDTN